MRFVLAISALVLSGILLILGIGQTTFLAGPRAVVHSIDLDGDQQISVIPADVLDSVQGQANVMLTGAEPVIATGHNRDVHAWVAPFEHVAISEGSSAGTFTETQVGRDVVAAEQYAAIFAPADAEAEAEPEGEGEQPTNTQFDFDVPNPAGSDLWLEERVAAPQTTDDATADDAADTASPSDEAASDEQVEAPLTSTVRMAVKLKPDESVLVYVAEPAPDSKLSIEWVQDRRVPWAGPLLLGGAIFAVVGAVLYLLAVDHDRRGLGPRRGRKGPLLGIRDLFVSKKRAATVSNPQSSDAPQSSENSEPDRKSEFSATTKPREGTRRMRWAIPTIGLVFVVGLTGCSPSYWPDLSPEPTESLEIEPTEAPTAAAPVPLTRGQLDRILSDVVELSDAADASLDETGLDARFVGDALTERVANYTIRRSVSDYEVVVPRLTTESLGYQLVQSTETWPRTVFTVVASESGEPPAEEADEAAEGEAAAPEESPSIAIIMSQATPHSNYLVSRTIALRGGISMPEAAPAEEGTARLANDIQSLVMMPKDVGPAYAALLQGGTDEDGLFDLEDDTLLQRSGAAWQVQSTEAAAASGQGIVYSVTAEQSSSRVISLSTGAGGALVATTVRETRVEDPGGSTWRPLVPASITALSGLEGRQDMLVSVVSHQLLFFVPSSADGGSIELLGYTSDLVEGRNS